MNRLQHLATILVITVAAGLVMAPWASGKGKTEKLTGVVTQLHSYANTYSTSMTVALRRGGTPVGKITFPKGAPGNAAACNGLPAPNYVCGGKMKLKGLGSGLSVLFTWICNSPSGHCSEKSATSLYIDNKSGKDLGTITLKTAINFKKGKHFPVVVNVGKIVTPP